MVDANVAKSSEGAEPVTPGQFAYALSRIRAYPMQGQITHNLPWHTPQWFCVQCLRVVRDRDVGPDAQHTMCGAECVLPVDGSALQYDWDDHFFSKTKFNSDGILTGSVSAEPRDGWPAALDCHHDDDGTWSLIFKGTTIVRLIPCLKAVKLLVRYLPTGALA